MVVGAEFLLYDVYRNELMFLRRFLEAVEFRGFFKKKIKKRKPSQSVGLGFTIHRTIEV